MVVELRRGPGAQLHDEPFDQQALDDAVERARAELHLAGRLLLDLLEDRVAVLVSIGQGQQYVEHRRRQRRLRIGHWVALSSASRDQL